MGDCVSLIEKALEKQSAEHSSDLGEEKNDLDIQVDVSSKSEEKEKEHWNDLASSNKNYIKVDLDFFKEKGMLSPDDPHGQLAEEYRIIKQPLLLNAFGEGKNEIENANLILVTSSLPGEGKTFTSVNLAMSIATELDKRVLLVDADVVKPAASKLFGVEERSGLIDLLEKDVTFKEVLLRTDFPKLTFLPAGRRHKHATELLSSDAMRKLAKEMSQRYPDRIIIFDSPPLLATTQASVLAKHVGQVVLVVEAESTPQYIVQESAASLSECDVVGCVLNKTKQGFGLGYYAYYGYKYYNYNN
ncbi:MAG: hypothetical protein AXA67_08575 [Methylothermaceae bacteria B42]|nr:MAG: hypothetical protein AXA67_08575 [Methylothermaceae bacteria B42]HHJ39894.1 tyrosine-protein kinase family protein [Methylothermaceae bacterium]